MGALRDETANHEWISGVGPRVSMGVLLHSCVVVVLQCAVLVTGCAVLAGIGGVVRGMCVGVGRR